ADTLSRLDHQFKTARVRIDRELRAECPGVVAKAGEVQQVFLNLFVNARDAMPEGGELRILTDTVDSKIEIIVQDTGVGISSENIQNIYDPYFTTQADENRIELGLSVNDGI